MLERFANKFLEKSSFPEIISLDYELKKLNFLRIVLGLIIFIRFFQISDYYHIYNGECLIASLITLVLIGFFIIGFSLPITTTLLFFFVRYSDSLTNTGTLGTSILMQTLLVFVLVNSGDYYSVDSWLIKKKNLLSKAIKFQYSIIGKHNFSSLRNVYFFAFLIYALISLGAILAHFQDHYWVDGLTVKSLLSNSYLSLYFEEFRWFESSYPTVSSLFSIIGGILQSIFQVLMIGLIFFKPGTFFVKWWGMMFFIISFFVINLSYLPHIEIVLWLIIFYPSPINFKIFERKNRISKSNLFSEPRKPNKALLKLFYITYSVVCLMFILSWFPFISKCVPEIFGKKNKYMKGIVYKAGLEIPNVFNYVDLSMGDIWMVIYRKKENSDKWDLVPITAENGMRLNYNGINFLNFSNHNSDFLYFGTSLEYRREVLSVKNYKAYHEKGFGYQSFKKRVEIDFEKENLNGNYTYKFVVYKNKSSKVSHWKENSQRHNKETIYANEYNFDGNVFKLKSK